ncbi:helix-turn-helix domain-containing protein [Streptomyces sp. NPDC051840]|uniref:ArsR/SmtB family transcription factor n=1 Tax=Streptomyces sp. NPDC051840 TaxID=3154752 RepID=UPI00343F9A3F
MYAVFKALADHTRRALLDELFRQDGQTSSALEARFTITRFAVMKHLRTLEAAGLVLTRRQGRVKLHFLNPVPVRLVHDRWVSGAGPPGSAVSSVGWLEAPMEKVFETYIRTTPERLWDAITDPDIRSGYNFGARVISDWTEGSRFETRAPGAAGRSAKGAIRRWIRRGGWSRAWSRRGATR